MIHSDADFMKHCFYLAEKGRGMTSPNPLVGCVIVQNDEIVATGYHRKAGLAHAELDAIENTQANLKGATLYCNLEPCCHTNKKTPPCAQRIILENISKVVIANLDPNPYVAGRGVELLRKNGIEVITGVLEEEGEKLNEIFFKNMREQKPFVHLKIAQTLDGKIATNTGSSQWITNENLESKCIKCASNMRPY
jgi:diaminohydroxyphosphoribosylaminopyrimidine deaminase/5-amino-6-(5-phosphoribosylamino)uracil reductase